jgi:hypothetical protein
MMRTQDNMPLLRVPRHLASDPLLPQRLHGPQVCVAESAACVVRREDKPSAAATIHADQQAALRRRASPQAQQRSLFFALALSPAAAPITLPLVLDDRPRRTTPRDSLRITVFTLSRSRSLLPKMAAAVCAHTTAEQGRAAKGNQSVNLPARGFFPSPC